MEYRIEKDTMGQVQVPASVYWGAQTQRSIENFKIAQDINKMPREIIRAFAYLKKAAALTNLDAGVLPQEKSDLIGQACDEILDGPHSIVTQQASTRVWAAQAVSGDILIMEI